MNFVLTRKHKCKVLYASNNFKLSSVYRGVPLTNLFARNDKVHRNPSHLLRRVAHFTPLFGIIFLTAVSKIIRLQIFIFTVTECGSVLQGKSGNFHSPNYPSSYPLDVECEWKITAPSESQKIVVTFLTFNVEYSGGCAYV